jgi:adenosylcobinamide-GDP ribazoletransferase
MREFLLALSFLTILPAGRFFPAEEKALARSMAFFPIAGLLIGVLAAAGYYLMSLIFPRTLVLWLVIALIAVLTRGIHLDGLADTVDGVACGGTREKILEVMRDSRIGTFGVLALVILMGAKYLALDQIPASSLSASLIVMVVIGRSAMVLVCYRSVYARSSGGLGKAFTDHVGTRELMVSSLTCLVISLFAIGPRGILVFSAAAFFSIGYRQYFMKKLGGVTGDILGGANECAELLTVLLLVILG